VDLHATPPASRRYKPPTHLPRAVFIQPQHVLHASMRAMYSSSSFATHHIFFPPRFQVVAFQQYLYGLPSYVWNQLAPDRFFGQQPHCPACPSLRRWPAGYRDDALPLLLIQRRSLTRTRAIEQRTIQAALLVAFADLPHRLGRKPEADTHRRGGPSIVHLPQSQHPQYRPHRLQTAAQQLVQSLAITPGKLKTQSSAHALVISPGHNSRQVSIQITYLRGHCTRRDPYKYVREKRKVCFAFEALHAVQHQVDDFFTTLGAC
jgi:hypothetical protein